MKRNTNDILIELERATQNKWEEVPGIFAYTSVTGDKENITFNPTQGVLVKLFINTVTAELKSYPAKYIQSSDTSNLE